MSKEIQKIKEYWDNRAKEAKQNVNGTTDDVFLRELEIRSFVQEISKIKKKKIKALDVGCGDGYTTLGIADALPNIEFTGVDYSPNMILNANKRLKKISKNVAGRVKFEVADATSLLQSFKPGQFDLVISSRCLINLSSPKQQYQSIADISELLKSGGYYISTENFKDGNDELNTTRKAMGLAEIPVRWHNLFFNTKEYLTKTKKLFKNVHIINFSSAYYYATRVVYSKYCQMKNIKPDYTHEIHRLAIDLPEMGDFSPIKLVTHKK